MQRFPYLLRIFQRPQASRSLVGASGLLLGIWGTAYFLSSPSRTLHLDSDGKRGSFIKSAKAVADSETRQDASDVVLLARQKALAHFKKAQYVYDDKRLHEH